MKASIFLLLILFVTYFFLEFWFDLGWIEKSCDGYHEIFELPHTWYNQSPEEHPCI